ncbi:MAG: leucine-rich repeat domain-containing protein [Ruminococcus sp.]|nr:leucine-rich repeat domain-containing protein [Ruminococcus sp.]
MTDYNTPHYVPWYDIRNNIKSVIIENGITDIGRNAFYTCTSLESVTIPDSVTSIGYRAFQRCTGLTSIEIPDSVTSIDDYAFEFCTGLTSITIPDSVTSIGTDAFYNCTNITDVYCDADPEKLTWYEFCCDDFMGAPESRETVCHVPKKDLETYEENFGAESENPVNVRFVGDVDMGLGEHLYGHSITLDGSIGVNFYVELTDELLASETAEMIFTIPNGSKTDTQTLLVKDVIADESNKVSIGSKTYYKFKCSISAKDMASTITAQLVDGEKSGTEYTYSVKDYAEYLLEHTEVEEYANAAPLVKAMLNYGAASQTYFGIEGTAANAELDDADKELGEVSIPETFQFDDESAALPEGVTFEGATLSLKSETTLSLYFNGLPEGTEFTCDSKTVETAKNGEYVVARIRGINASELENDFTVTFEGDSVTYNVTYNVMTYFYNVLNDGTVDDNLQNVCKALYRYAEEASKYFGGIN